MDERRRGRPLGARTTQTEDKQRYKALLTAARSDPELSKAKLARLFDLSPATVSKIINRADALAQELSQPQRDKMVREWRLSFFRLQAMEAQLADDGTLNPRDAQALQIAKAICQDKTNVLEGMPSEINVNIDLIRADLPSIARRIVEGARIAGMLGLPPAPPASEAR